MRKAESYTNIFMYMTHTENLVPLVDLKTLREDE